MEFQKIINLLDNTSDQQTKFRTKNWVEINDESGGTYSTNSQIKFKTSMLRSSLTDYSDTYILVSGTVVFENCAPFTDCISEINNTQIENAKYIDLVMST